MTLMKSGVAALGILGLAFIILLATRTTQTNGPNFDIVGQQSPPIEGLAVNGENFELEKVLLEN